jgi:hypothetical protein
MNDLDLSLYAHFRLSWRVRCGPFNNAFNIGEDSRRPGPVSNTSPDQPGAARRGAAKQQPPLDAVSGGGRNVQSIVTVARASRRSVYLRPWRRQHLAVRSPRFEPKLFSHWQGSSVHSQGSVCACVAGAVCRRHDVAGHGWPAQQFHWLPIPACTSQFRGTPVYHMSGSRPGKSYQRDKIDALSVF